MILIVKDEDTNPVIFTLDGRVWQPTLFLKNDANRKTYELDLPDDTSLYPERCNLFLMDISDFADMDEGYYNYEIKEAGTGYVIEQGKLLIQPTQSAPIPTAETPGEDILILN